MKSLFHKTVCCILVLLCSLAVSAQFAPQAGIAGSTAIPHNSPSLIGWATGCTVQRGYLDIAHPSAGLVTSGEDAMAVGQPDNQVVSLGDSGVATLTFSGYITNGPGPDFVVFENGFPHPQDAELAFLELAFVEVSSDGVQFTRFPAECHVQDTQQIAGAGMFVNARQIHNLAGKYKARFGTPFDLEELSGTSGLDINRITHVRIVDVVGSIDPDYGTHDKDDNLINDPYPTPFDVGTKGFDLDAVGVIHHVSNSIQTVGATEFFQVYPNPAETILHIRTGDRQSLVISLTDVTGRVLYSGQMFDGVATLPLGHYPSGIYYITLEDTSGMKWTTCVSRR